MLGSWPAGNISKRGTGVSHSLASATLAPKDTACLTVQVQTGSSTGRNEGYKYFGAAKLLPGVRELFEKEPPRKVRRTKHQMHQKINADYYGFRDDEDGILEREEAKAEKTMRAEVGREESIGSDGKKLEWQASSQQEMRDGASRSLVT